MIHMPNVMTFVKTNVLTFVLTVVYIGIISKGDRAMKRITYCDPATGHAVTAVKHKTPFGARWLITGSFIREAGEWVQDGLYFDKWVRNWEESGLTRA